MAAFSCFLLGKLCAAPGPLPTETPRPALISLLRPGTGLGRDFNDPDQVGAGQGALQVCKD